MKAILTILSFWFITANATTYYVSNAGSDAANGLTTVTSWQTLSKVNAFAFQVGDSILLKGGDTLGGILQVKYASIYIGSYGTGRAYISGLKQAVLTQKGLSNVWAATITDAATNLNTVVINDSIRIKARYPNSTYLRFNDTTSTATQLNTSLTGTPNYSGFPIVVRSAMYLIDNSTVGTQSAGTLPLTTSLSNTPNLGGNGFFFQNDSTLLDSNYEWSKQGNRFLVYLPSATPVYYSGFDIGIRIMHVRNVKIENINVIGFNIIGIQYDTSNASILNNCTTNYIGITGISVQKCDSLNITHSNVRNCLNTGAYLNLANYLNWDYDTTSNIAMYAGMGQSNNLTYMGMFILQDHNKIVHSIFHDIGFNGIYAVGRFDSIMYNYFYNFCTAKTDGSAIYTWLDGSSPINDGGSAFHHDWDSGMYWGHNIAVNGVSNLSGCNPNSIYYGAGTSGFYTDLNANTIKIEYNTGAYNYGNVLSIGSGAHDDTIRYNNFYNNKDRVRDLLGTTTSTYSMLINSNVYYLGDSSSNEIFDYYTGGNAARLTQDSNYYTGIGVNNLYKQAFNVYSFAQYVAATAYDTHGGTNPTNTRNRTAIIVYNPTMSDSTIYLPGGSYVDKTGNTIYVSYITLHAFESAILYPYQYSYYQSKTTIFH